MNNAIGFNLTIIDLTITFQQLLSSAYLPGAQVFRFYNIASIVVINKNKNFMLATFLLTGSRFQYINNSQKLASVGLVSSLYLYHFLREEN